MQKMASSCYIEVKCSWAEPIKNQNVLHSWRLIILLLAHKNVLKKGFSPYVCDRI